MSRRVELFGVSIDVMRMPEAVSVILESKHSETNHRCRFVVTPNVDHAVMLETSEPLRAAYAEADLVLADGWPVVLASRLLGKALPERVTGSDLVPAVFNAAEAAGQALRIYLLGAGPGVAERAALAIAKRWKSVEVVGTYSPPFGFEKDAQETQAILARINTANPDLLIVGLGAPKQELWVHRHHEQLSARWALCVGACIDFLAGEKRRAPRWMQRCGFEWLFRLASEPRRLFRRYAYDAIRFPRLVYKEMRSPKRSAPLNQAEDRVSV